MLLVFSYINSELSIFVSICCLTKLPQNLVGKKQQPLLIKKAHDSVHGLGSSSGVDLISAGLTHVSGASCGLAGGWMTLEWPRSCAIH